MANVVLQKTKGESSSYTKSAYRVTSSTFEHTLAGDLTSVWQLCVPSCFAYLSTCVAPIHGSQCILLCQASLRILAQPLQLQAPRSCHCVRRSQRHQAGSHRLCRCNGRGTVAPQDAANPRKGHGGAEEKDYSQAIRDHFRGLAVQRSSHSGHGAKNSRNVPYFLFIYFFPKKQTFFFFN